MKLAGKVAVITGSARGLGLAIATCMAEVGARVVLADINEQGLAEAVAGLQARRLQATGYACDISKPEGNAALIAKAVSTHGRVDIFHANAAIGAFKDLLETAPTEVQAAIGVNLAGAIYGCAAVLPTMIAQRAGVILLTASVAAFRGDPSTPVYCATKGGLTALCKAIAVRHGPEGIRCNTICPGDIRTPMLEEFLAKAQDPAVVRGEIIGNYPMRRLGEPDDIGRLAVFLASDDASWITGTDIVIDGGLSASAY